MISTFYVRINSRGSTRGVTKSLPDLARDEIAFRLKVKIPDSAFRSPVFNANITVDSEQVIVPDVDVQVLDVEPVPESKEASNINNEGKEGQIEYLADAGWEEE